MDIEYSIVNIITLFGAIQGFLLCWLVYKKRAGNPKATKLFVLFLFSLSFLNLHYALMDMKILDSYAPSYMLPFPYKYFLAPAFFFYLRSSVKITNGGAYNKAVLWLWAPAVIYGIMRSYWFYIAVKESSYRIIAELVVSNFFRVNEFVFLIFTTLILIAGLRFLKKAETSPIGHQKGSKNINWLKLFSKIFLGLILINFVLTIVDLIVHDGDDTMLFNYPNLIINSAFIYWIGYIGFLKPNVLIAKIKRPPVSTLSPKEEQLAFDLSHSMEQDELYKNKDLTLLDLSTHLDISPKELSNFLNDVLRVNFSEYLNRHRVEKVKVLIASADLKKYTLFALAQEAGFKSKSAFNESFKRAVGMTPSEYLRAKR